MKLVNLKVLALLVISYSIALVAMTPLSWVFPLVEPKLNQLGIQVGAIEGTVWQGRGQISERNVGQLDLEWDVNAAQLILLKAPIDLTVSNADMDVSGQLTLSPFRMALSGVSGYVDEQAFSQIYEPYRATLSGRLQLSDVSADMGWRRKLGDAGGQMTWSGGPVSMPVGRSVQTYEVPTLLGNINSDEDGWKASVTGGDNVVMLEADLTRDWVVTYAVKSALADAMNIQLPDLGENLIKRSFEVGF